ncbi:DUF4253 domain-containing protein [Leptospira semungkisensis]|uniref:DUF4253 domain-containing protein n=1 Tax=Leptospira semungkisensis TaxID=2484985 RepID=A0A4R9G5G1_9LEPT|nr:DUF4253 domain-containing protein [Leptospira semungkisensis]TGK06788.1 DUF4253 domain-containing protein [Leptospira semungkisensis]
MQRIFLVLIFLSLFFSSCSKSEIGGNRDKEVLELVRKFTNSKIEKFYIRSQEASKDGEDILLPSPGISLRMKEDEALDLLGKLRPRLEEWKYTIFLTGYDAEFEGGNYNAFYQVVIVYDQDKYELLRKIGTSAPRYNIDTDSIEKKFKQWEEKYSSMRFVIIDSDSISALLMDPPKNPKQLAKEAYDFCPDAVEQNLGSLEEMEKMILEEHLLPLWWD